MKDLIGLEEFQKLDLRVGRIASVEIPEGLDRVYKMTVDLGPELGQKTIFAGIRNYPPETLIGRQVVVVVNLLPKKIKDWFSEGMILAVDGEWGPILLIPEREVSVGIQIK